MRLRGAVVLIVVGVALTGCGTPSATPSPEPTAFMEQMRESGCSTAADDVVAAVANLVAEYGPQQTSAPTPTPAATPGADASDPLAEAVTRSTETRRRLGCDDADFRTRLSAGLADIEPDGPVAGAVLRRVSATLFGEQKTGSDDWAVTSADDLLDVIARAAPDTTLVLPAGTWSLAETLVLMDGITLRGASVDDTRIQSAAPEVAVLVATAGLVRMQDLSLELVGTAPASGLVAGPSASIALSAVRVSGATAGGEGVGGAGVYLSTDGVGDASRGTTLEVTDGVFADNDWAGIAVAGTHRVSIESSRFTGNGDVGMLFLDGTAGSVNGSSFVDNGVGIAIAGTADPALLDTAISGGGIGVQADQNAEPVLQGLRISGSTTAAVIFGGASGGSISTSTCTDAAAGIVVSDGAAPTLGAGNECRVARGG